MAAAKAAADKFTEAEEDTSAETKFEGWEPNARAWYGQHFIKLDDLGDSLDEIGEGELRAFTTVETKHDMEIAKGIIDGDEDLDLGVTILRMVPRGYRKDADEVVINVSGSVSGKVRVRRAVMTHHGKAANAAPTLINAQCKVDATGIKETVALRFSTEKRYVTEPGEGSQRVWNDFVKKHAQHISKWVKKKLRTEAINAVTRIIGFVEDAGSGGGRAILTGLVIVEKDFLDEFDDFSGLDQWYVEPLRWDVAGLSGRVKVEWIDRVPGESGRAHAIRVAKMNSGRGIARGHRQLGVRTTATGTEAAKMRTWKITGAPDSWSANTVMQKMRENGLEDVTGPCYDRAGPKVDYYRTWNW